MNEQKSWSDKNRLHGCGNPYLEQHAGNPVHWLPWTQSAFDEARRLNRPVLVSIGYSTCHWCHVLARESFENPLAAKLMNQTLINVKVDREQHPEVDAIYMEAAQAMSGGSGWPLNVFTDTDGRPFYTVTYLPVEQWTALIMEIGNLWTNEKSRIEEVAMGVSSQLRLHSNHLPEATVQTRPESWSSKLLAYTKASYDKNHPGFSSGASPMKFPPSQILDWLLEHGGIEGRSTALTILETMMDSGLHDRVGGGFHRYSVDTRWRVPHFEKMAYDNAQLMGIYARASLFSTDNRRSSNLLAASEGIADWFLREMRVYKKRNREHFLGYATATDADDPLGEGAYYAWPPLALEEALGKDDAQWIARRWDISGLGQLPTSNPVARESSHGGVFEPIPGWIPHPRGAEDYSRNYRGSEDSPDTSKREKTLIAKLFDIRSKRPAPGRDTKVLTDQNALILEGLVRLARYGGGNQYQTAAMELADLLISNLDATGENVPEGSIHVYRTQNVDAYITDYGYLSMALAATYTLTGISEYAHAAGKVANQAIELLSTGNGLYYSTPAGRADLFKRPIENYDGPSPAGSHALGIAFARLYSITGIRKWAEHADRLIGASGTIAEDAPAFSSSLIRLASIRKSAQTLVVAGPQNHPDTVALLDLARRLSGPDIMVVAADQADIDANWPQLEGRTSLNQPQLLVCRENECLLPALTLEEARDRLIRTGLSVPEAS